MARRGRVADILVVLIPEVFPPGILLIVHLDFLLLESGVHLLLLPLIPIQLGMEPLLLDHCIHFSLPILVLLPESLLLYLPVHPSPKHVQTCHQEHPQKSG